MGRRLYTGAMTPTLKKYVKEYNSKSIQNRLRLERNKKISTNSRAFILEQIATTLRTEAATDHTAALLQTLQHKYKVNTKSPEMMMLLDLLYKDAAIKGIKGESKNKDITTLANEFATAFNIPSGKMGELRKMLAEYKTMIKTQKEIKTAMKNTKQVSVKRGKIVMYDKKSTSPNFIRVLRKLIGRPKLEIPKF